MRTKLTNAASIPGVIADMTTEEKVKFLILPTPCISQAIPDMDIPSVVLADGATGVNGTHIMLDFLMEMAAKAGAASGASMEGNAPGGASAEGNASGNASAEGNDSSNVAAGMGNIWVEMQELVDVSEEEAARLAKGNPIKMAFLQYLKNRRNTAGASVSFPSGINIGATFRPEQAKRIGKAVGQEMRSAHLDVCLGPNVDIMRDPLGGRNYEMYGEDPALVRRIAPAFISGMQSTGTAACAKHYIANNQENRRETKDTHVSIRTLREIYAKGFEASVKEAGVKSVMSAYNAVNGVFSSYNKMILTDWLKEEWGFDGVIVSDWGAASKHPQDSIAAGLDVTLNGPGERAFQELAEAMESGKLDEARVNDALTRFLQLVIWIRDSHQEIADAYDQKQVLKEAYDTLVDGSVLLKNENGVLPLDKSSKTAFYGTRAKDTMECGSGSTMVNTCLHGNVYDESAALGVEVFDGCMEDADVVVYAAGAEGGENADRPAMDVDAVDQRQIVSVLKEAKEAGKKTVVLLNVAGPVDVRAWEPYADAILAIFVPGCMGGKAMADILYGEAIPAGRLPMTFPECVEDVPTYPYLDGEYDDVYYGEGVFVGYRWYDKKQVPVRYPFGYGLSYTTFEISDVNVPQTYDTNADGAFTITAKIKNTGNARGAQVLQVYMGEKRPKVLRPVKELKGFVKVDLEPGEEREVAIAVTAEDLRMYDPAKGVVLPVGEYRVYVGTDCRTILHEAAVKVIGKNVYCLGRHSTLGDIMAVPEAVAAVEKVIPGFISRMGDHAKLLAANNFDAMFSRHIIQSQPDSVKAKEIMDGMYAELEKIEF